MYLCCVESLSWFRSKLNFLQIFKVAPKSGQRLCTIILQGFWPNFDKNEKERILHFITFPDTYTCTYILIIFMYCTLSFTAALHELLFSMSSLSIITYTF